MQPYIKEVCCIKIQYIILALVIFGFLIFIHELGHYLCARLFRVSIKEFAIGMGPKLVRWTSKKTSIAYSLRLLPIGGYVSMEGEDAASEDENAFSKKPVWQRIIVTVAGAFMNIFVGVLVMSTLVIFQETLPSTTVAVFDKGEESLSYQAGLREGDTITKVGKTRVYTANDVVYQIMRKGVDPIDLTVRRNNETVVIEDVVFPTFTDSGAVFGEMDFRVFAEDKTFMTVLKHAVSRSVSTIVMIWDSLFDLFSGRYGVETVSGPVGVTEALGEAAEEGSTNLIYLAVVISMNLGVMNLLPLPALDGGRLVFQLIELVRRKPVRPEIEGYVHFAGLVLLMILMVVITCKDIVKLM